MKEIGQVFRKACLFLCKETHSPVAFWLSLDLAEFMKWHELVFETYQKEYPR